MVELIVLGGAGNTGGSIALTGTVTFTSEDSGLTEAPVLLSSSVGWS